MAGLYSIQFRGGDIFFPIFARNYNATMSITKESELAGMKKASEAVAQKLKEMTQYAAPGMTTKHLDEYGAALPLPLPCRTAGRW
jgi:hypothetical protein